MRAINRLPGPDDGAEGLLALAEAFGPQQVFDLIRLCRLDAGPDARPAAEVSTMLAQRMVTDYMERHNVDRDHARRAVAKELGYSDTARTNFYKIEQGIARRRLNRTGPTGPADPGQ